MLGVGLYHTHTHTHTVHTSHPPPPPKPPPLPSKQLKKHPKAELTEATCLTTTASEATCLTTTASPQQYCDFTIHPGIPTMPGMSTTQHSGNLSPPTPVSAGQGSPGTPSQVRFRTPPHKPSAGTGHRKCQGEEQNQQNWKLVWHEDWCMRNNAVANGTVSPSETSSPLPSP